MAGSCVCCRGPLPAEANAKRRYCSVACRRRMESARRRPAQAAQPLTVDEVCAALEPRVVNV